MKPLRNYHLKLHGKPYVNKMSKFKINFNLQGKIMTSLLHVCPVGVTDISHFSGLQVVVCGVSLWAQLKRSIMTILSWLQVVIVEADCLNNANSEHRK